MRHSMTIVVPVYNEKDNLVRLGKELKEFIGQSEIKSTVLFVNDGSTDESLKIIKQLCIDKSIFNYIDFDKNYGLSAAIKAGFDFAESSLIAYIDADLQTSPMDFNLLLPFIDDYQLVTGVRIDRKDSIVKKISSKIANAIRHAFTRDGMDDTGCPLKIINSEYAKRMPMFKGLHRFLPAMVLLQNGTVNQIPIRHFPRISGETKFGLWNRIIGPLVDCFAYLWMKKRYINYQISSRG